MLLVCPSNYGKTADSIEMPLRVESDEQKKWLLDGVFRHVSPQES